MDPTVRVGTLVFRRYDWVIKPVGKPRPRLMAYYYCIAYALFRLLGIRRRFIHTPKNRKIPSFLSFLIIPSFCHFWNGGYYATINILRPLTYVLVFFCFKKRIDLETVVPSPSSISRIVSSIFLQRTQFVCYICLVTLLTALLGHVG